MIERLDEQAYARARFQYLAAVYFPIWFLAAYGTLSLILFSYSPSYRDFVAGTPTRAPWLTDIFPILDEYSSSLARRPRFLTLGYFFHLHLMVLLTAATAVGWQLAAWRSIRRFLFARISRDSRYRRRYRHPEEAFGRILLALGFFVMCLVVVCLGWSWFEGGRRSYRWHNFLFPIFYLPLFYGVPIFGMLGALQSISVLLTPDARQLRWGPAAASEGGGAPAAK